MPGPPHQHVPRASGAITSQATQQRLDRHRDSDDKSKSSPASTPFTCTFCWLPSLGPPRVLGRTAPRLACAACHAAVLDLAICWVCGELVFRGDECVSLG